ncbi:hypothetical protein DLE54_03615 [Psychrobacter sp. YP14]|uniref:hypothetical protein n=1 Tax=Psychrobacter sp. YP14 TaxID=2203895 RepID=UPI000D7D278E|nr:hypothetical protein [Psychrobacter sp. YP14]AWT48708.1 hypothetical protein DLE54_03615 [Psychrobacter sp. YP14]
MGTGVIVVLTILLLGVICEMAEKGEKIIEKEKKEERQQILEEIELKKLEIELSSLQKVNKLPDSQLSVSQVIAGCLIILVLMIVIILYFKTVYSI